MTVRFTVHTDHPYAPKAWIRVVVHDTVDELRTAAAKHSGEDHLLTGTEACFQPTPYRERVNADGTWETAPGQRYAGVLRLPRDCDGLMVAHECVHAAASVFRRTYGSQVDLGDDCGEREEAFAYLVGEFSGGIANRLHEIGAR